MALSPKSVDQSIFRSVSRLISDAAHCKSIRQYPARRKGRLRRSDDGPMEIGGRSRKSPTRKWAEPTSKQKCGGFRLLVLLLNIAKSLPGASRFRCDEVEKNCRLPGRISLPVP